MGICMRKNLKATIDSRRGDVPRSVFITKILEENCKDNEKENMTRNNMSDQWSLSRRQPRGFSTDPSVLPEERDATDG